MQSSGRKRYTSTEARGLLHLWQRSGKSKKQFAEENGLNYSTLVGWSNRFGKELGKPGFAQIALSSGRDLFAEVTAGSCTVRFYQPFPSTYFELLLKSHAAHLQ